MRVAVTGGRYYNNRMFLFKVLDDIHRETPIDVIIHGNATGADELAGEWARWIEVNVEIYHAKWTVFGKAAGPIRNKEMITEGNPDVVVALYGGKGTKNMVGLAKEYEIKVIEHG